MSLLTAVVLRGSPYPQAKDCGHIDMNGDKEPSCRIGSYNDRSNLVKVQNMSTGSLSFAKDNPHREDKSSQFDP